MSSPKINTYREIRPLIYSWRTSDVPKYEGWEKIGYTEQESAETRISQQASQLSISKETVWVFQAQFMTATGGKFTDRDFHEYLRQQQVERELKPYRTEWHRFAGQPKNSRQYFFDFASQDLSTVQTSGESDYVLRPEQEAAVEQALAAFAAGEREVLWNAKPRFGKTLTTYDLMRRLDVRKALIVTNRPAIANSWFDDFVQFIGHRTTFKFVSESPSLSAREPLSRQQWRAIAQKDGASEARIIEFVSLQDLKGSEYFGGIHKKLKHIADFQWDLLVIDEAHEGVDTTKTDVAFDQIARTHTLHLSGTPFKALASGKFNADQIFNWTYQDEREALEGWANKALDNPYAQLPKLNMLTYQVSRMISDQLAVGVAVDDEEGNIDYTFDLGQFFATKDNGFFEHEAEIIKFLDCLTTNEKYPFSTPELRDEIRHSFWLLDRVASARALEKLLKAHDVFKDYTIVLAAGDGRSADADAVLTGKSLDRVHAAITAAEAVGGKTITLSVGQLTTGVTVPAWTAVIMLSNITSPALYMQAAFRAQNPYHYERDGKVLQKKNAYIFDFAPERTLTVYDAFANNLSPSPSGATNARQENIRRLLNFFPVIGEDADGRMVELDAEQVLTFPQVLKAREVVRRGFLSNLLFDNVAGIFRYHEHVKAILEKLPKAKAGKLKSGETIDMPEPIPVVDEDGNARVDADTVINPKVEGLGKPVWSVEEIAKVDRDTPRDTAVKQIVKAVADKVKPTREKLKEDYDLSNAVIERDERQTEARVQAEVERALVEREIAHKHFDDEEAAAATESEAEAVQTKRAEHDEAFRKNLMDIVTIITDNVAVEVVTREETKKEQKRANDTMDDARAHLRGFARTIPMFLMAYGHRGTTLATFDDDTPDDVFEEITGITEEDFRKLRDGQEVTEADGTVVKIPGMFDSAVFDQSIQEFLNKKEELADYFDDSRTENIFAYIPQQRTSLVFTPQSVVTMMVDALEAENPGIFEDSTKTFADLFSTAGLFLMELVRRLDAGLADQIPDHEQRLKHILTSQIFEMSHNEILHKITMEAVSGGVPERKQWLQDSGHFKVGDLARMTPEERQDMVNDMLTRGN